MLVAGYLGYGAAERATFAAAVAAQARGDCATATPAFDAVTGPYRLTLADDVPNAAARRAECAAYTAASMTQDTGAVAAAEDALRAFRNDHPGSVLTPYVDERLATMALRRVDTAVTTLATQTGAARAATVRTGDRGRCCRSAATSRTPRRRPGCPRRCRRLLGRRRASVRRSAQFCAVLPTLDYARHAARGGDRRDRGHRPPHRPQAQLGCGLAEFRADRFPQAADHMRDLLAELPRATRARPRPVRCSSRRTSRRPRPTRSRCPRRSARPATAR